MSVDESDKPEEPNQEDCCKNGCVPCVFDIYQAQVKLWEQKSGCNNPVRNDYLSQTRYKPFVLKKVMPLTINTNLYKFQPATEASRQITGYLPFRVGQHLFLRYTSGDDQTKILTRAYTIVTNNEEKENCSFQVLIKLYKDGIMSNYVSKLRPGDITYWRGPCGDFIYNPNKFPYILMICMGTGIAPMYAVIKEILNNEDDETQVLLMFGCRNSSEIILREELYKLNSFWNFNYTCYMTQHSSDKRYYETFIDGKISKEHIKSSIKFPVEKLQVLICGNIDFAEEIFNYLITFDVPKKNIFIF